MVSGGAGRTYKNAAMIATAVIRSRGPADTARSRKEISEKRAKVRNEAMPILFFFVIDDLFPRLYSQSRRQYLEIN